MFKSFPTEGSESARLMYLLLIGAAEHSIKVGNPYFVPDDLAQQTLVEALERGVSVEILLPGSISTLRSCARPRAIAGANFSNAKSACMSSQPTMYHCKLMIIDSHWTSVGSANFDNRSFRLNDEANLNVIDREIAAAEVQAFAQTKPALAR